MTYWTEEYNEIIPEVKETLENAKRWQFDIDGLALSDIATADTNRLDQMCTELAESIDKLNEFYIKLSALAYAKERMDKGE